MTAEDPQRPGLARVKLVDTPDTVSPSESPTNHKSDSTDRQSEIRCYDVLVALRRIMRAVDMHSRYLVREFGLTGPQIIILRELSELGEVAVGELANAVSLSQATVTGILDRLEKRNLVHRRRDDVDKRRVMVYTTSAGEATLRVTPPMLQESFVRSYARLAEWEQTQLLSSLQRVVAMMEATELEATPMLTTGEIDATVEETEDQALP